MFIRYRPQPGRRYGPSIKGNGERGTTLPLSKFIREANYREQCRRLPPAAIPRGDHPALLNPGAYAHLMRLTFRQRRRVWHKANHAVYNGKKVTE